jgi:hypothetical protein
LRARPVAGVGSRVLASAGVLAGVWPCIRSCILAPVLPGIRVAALACARALAVMAAALAGPGVLTLGRPVTKLALLFLLRRLLCLLLGNEADLEQLIAQ